MILLAQPVPTHWVISSQVQEFKDFFLRERGFVWFFSGWLVGLKNQLKRTFMGFLSAYPSHMRPQWMETYCLFLQSLVSFTNLLKMHSVQLFGFTTILNSTSHSPKPWRTVRPVFFFPPFGSSILSIYPQFDYKRLSNVFLNQNRWMLLLSLHPKKHQPLSHRK